jgi:hypothetical protein
MFIIEIFYSHLLLLFFFFFFLCGSYVLLQHMNNAKSTVTVASKQGMDGFSVITTTTIHDILFLGHFLNLISPKSDLRNIPLHQQDG